jgi:hypothetical protein
MTEKTEKNLVQIIESVRGTIAYHFRVRFIPGVRVCNFPIQENRFTITLRNGISMLLLNLSFYITISRYRCVICKVEVIKIDNVPSLYEGFVQTFNLKDGCNKLIHRIDTLESTLRYGYYVDVYWDCNPLRFSKDFLREFYREIPKRLSFYLKKKNGKLEMSRVMNLKEVKQDSIFNINSLRITFGHNEPLLVLSIEFIQSIWPKIDQLCIRYDGFYQDRHLDMKCYRLNNNPSETKHCIDMLIEELHHLSNFYIRISYLILIFGRKSIFLPRDILHLISCYF